MFLRSFVFIKYLRCNAGRITTSNAEQVTVLGVNCNYRSFSILSSRKCDDNAFFKRDFNIYDRSLLRILMFSNVVSDSKVPNDKESGDESSKGLISKSDSVNEYADIDNKILNKIPKTDITQINVKELEFKSNGKKLILEATADKNSNITNIVLKKESVLPEKGSPQGQ